MDLNSKAILTDIDICRWAGRRLDRKITEEVNEQHKAEVDAGRYNKLLLPKECFADIHRLTREARDYHKTMTLPWAINGRILPAVHVEKFSKRLAEYRTAFNDAADKFADDYPNRLKIAAKRLGDMYNAEEFPDPSKVRSMFSFHITYATISLVNDFRVEIASEHLADIKAQVTEQTERAVKGIIQDPVERIVKTVGKMSERLNGYKPASENGKAENTFRDSLVGNVRELSELLPGLNVTGNKTLASITKAINVKLCKHEPDVLREDDTVRAAVAKAADDILKQAESLMA